MAKQNRVEGLAMPTMAQPLPEKNYRITGLKLADRMPINFGGQEFDLANLSDADVAHLMAHPDQVPYLSSIVSEED